MTSERIEKFIVQYDESFKGYLVVEAADHAKTWQEFVTQSGAEAYASDLNAAYAQGRKEALADVDAAAEKLVEFRVTHFAPDSYDHPLPEYVAIEGENVPDDVHGNTQYLEAPTLTQAILSTGGE